MVVQIYLKMPKNYLKKDYRDKSFSGRLIGYFGLGAMDYEVYGPDLRETDALHF